MAMDRSRAAAFHLPALLASGMSCLWCGAAAVAAEAPAPEAIRLNFDWGDGLTATVRTSRAKSRSGAAGASHELVTEHTMQATRRPDGSYLVVARDHRFPKLSDASVDDRALFQATMGGAIEPPIIVSAAGEFQALVDFEKSKAQLMEMIASAVAREKPPDVRESSLAMMNQMITREMLEELVRTPWDSFIGLWTGAELELGEVYEHEEDVEAPMVENQTIRQIATFSLKGRIDCWAPLDAPVAGPAAVPAPRCVRLTMHSSFDPDDVKRLNKLLAERLAPKGKPVPEAVMRDPQLDVETDVIVDPATMRPYRGKYHKLVTYVIERNGVEKSVSEADTMTFNWTYPETQAVAQKTGD